MITTLTAVDTVFQQLAASAIKTAISGGIYKKRPLNSRLEDVIINSPTINATQLQEGLVNVNVHVPNLVISVNGVQDHTQPDTLRLQQLVDMAVLSLTDTWQNDGDINFTVQQVSGLIEEAENDSHYVNIRLLYYAVNI